MLANKLQKTLLAAATVLATLPGFAQTAQAGTPDVYGAIAYSQSTGVYTSAIGSKHEDAERGALYYCQQQSRANDCKVPVWFKNAWGALAVGSNGAYGSGWGYDTAYPSKGRAIAGRYAVQTCRKYGGVNCRVVYSREARYQVIDNGTVLNPVDR